jgi:hypothetical protein
MAPRPRNLRLDGHGAKRTQLSTRNLPVAADGLINTRPIPNPFSDECSYPTHVTWAPVGRHASKPTVEILDTIPLHVNIDTIRND